MLKNDAFRRKIPDGHILDVLGRADERGEFLAVDFDRDGMLGDDEIGFLRDPALLEADDAPRSFVTAFILGHFLTLYFFEHEHGNCHVFIDFDIREQMHEPGAAKLFEPFGHLVFVQILDHVRSGAVHHLFAFRRLRDKLLGRGKIPVHPGDRHVFDEGRMNAFRPFAKRVFPDFPDDVVKRNFLFHP